MKKTPAPAQVWTLCKKVCGCAHPPNHFGPCEIDAIPPIPKGRGAAVELTHVDSFLEGQERASPRQPVKSPTSSSSSSERTR